MAPLVLIHVVRDLDGGCLYSRVKSNGVPGGTFVVVVAGICSIFQPSCCFKTCCLIWSASMLNPSRRYSGFVCLDCVWVIPFAPEVAGAQILEIGYNLGVRIDNFGFGCHGCHGCHGRDWRRR
jgi:hypothetical protein